MDNKFLDKVLDQIVRETRIDRDEGRLYTPFTLSPIPSHFTILHLPSYLFSHHCKEVYGLNRYEIVYVWDKYKEIIRDKRDNNG